MKQMIKRLCFGVMGSKPVARHRAGLIKNAGLAVVLNLHRVAPPDGSSYSPLDPDIFKELLKFLKENFHICSFSELGDVPKSRPALVLSFDDGYRDFINYTMPILDEFDIRANQNIIPGCVTSGFPPLNVFIQDFIGKANEADLVRLDIPGVDMSKAKSNPIQVSAAIKNKPIAEQNKLAKKIIPYMLNCKGFQPTAMMTLEQVRQAATYHEIGVHSYEHATMTQETDEYFCYDAKRCKSYMKEELDMDAGVYAFPNGGYRFSQIAHLIDLGYETILLVDNAFGRKKDNILPRFNFVAAGNYEARFRAVGGFSPIHP